MAAMTVAQYAKLRGVSDNTVKLWIRKLQLDLPQNPGDERQRLILSEHKRQLDLLGRSAPKVPEAPEVPQIFDAEIIPDEVKPYDRSEETGMLLAEGSIVLAQSQNYDNTPDRNRLIQALQDRTARAEQLNTQAFAQIQTINRSRLDTRAAVDAARLLQIKEAAQHRAIQEFQIEEQIIEDTKLDLQLMSLGLPMGKPLIAEEELDSLLDSPPSPSSPSPSSPLSPF